MKPLLLSFLTLAASGCAVYAPTVPSTPILQHRQGEVSGVARGGVSWELHGAYSPAPGLLLAAESAIRSVQVESTTNNVTEKHRDTHRQAGLGIGTYKQYDGPRRTYLAGLVGTGVAAVDVHDLELFGSRAYFQARYNRYYGQAYVAQQNGQFTTGVSVRGTWVKYSELLQDGQPVTADYARFYLEPTLFMRYGTGPLQGQGTLGISLPGSYDRNAPYASTLSPSSGLFSLGLVFRPHLLKPRGESLGRQ